MRAPRDHRCRFLFFFPSSLHLPASLVCLLHSSITDSSDGKHPLIWAVSLRQLYLVWNPKTTFRTDPTWPLCWVDEFVVIYICTKQNFMSEFYVLSPNTSSWRQTLKKKPQTVLKWVHSWAVLLPHSGFFVNSATFTSMVVASPIFF